MRRKKKNKLKLDKGFKQALETMKSGRNVFITGKAGTGKSTLLEYFRENTDKSLAVLAPTGVAALNVHGQTIHSFFGFKPDITLQSVKKVTGPKAKMYWAIETIVIDEVSMVRADLLDCMDKFLRLNREDKPFGGVQMILIGDLYQLSPVVSRKEKQIFNDRYLSQYFFDAHSLKDLELDFVELETIYRQKDADFIDLLNSIRNNSVGEKELSLINERLDPWFKPPKGEFYVYLTTTNKLAEEINKRELAGVDADMYHFTGQIGGDFKGHYLPTEIDLKLKLNSQVMMVNNDTAGRWVNGSVGKVVAIGYDSITVELQNGDKVTVTPHTWDISRLYYNAEARVLDAENVGSFTQYPLRLAWAVTIHKGQGKTFEKAIIDIGTGTFAHGQVYVALSRCTSLDGIVLKTPIRKKDIIMDWKVTRFLTGYQYDISEKKCPLEDKVKLIEGAIANGSKLEITYLKSKDEKSRRVIEPKKVGRMESEGRVFIGVDAFCQKRNADKVFRVDWILEINEI